MSNVALDQACAIADTAFGDRRFVGAEDISGNSGEYDEICAVAGIEAAGLAADAGAG